MGSANACYYVVYCRTVYLPLVHRYEQVREPTRSLINLYSMSLPLLPQLLNKNVNDTNTNPLHQEVQQ